MVEATATALVLVHCQRGFIEGIPGVGAVHDSAPILKRLVDLMERARETDAPVVYLEEVSEPETDGPIHRALSPLPGEVVVRTRGPDVFGDSHLQGTLEAVGACHVVVAGFQSEACVETVVRGAAERGHRVTLVSDAHSTFDFPGEASATSVIAATNEGLASIANVTPSSAVDFSL